MRRPSRFQGCILSYWPARNSLLSSLTIRSTRNRHQEPAKHFFSKVRVARSVCFVDLFCLFVLFLLAIVLSVLLSFGHCVVCSSVFWPLCCLFFFNLRILITTLISANSSWTKIVSLCCFFTAAYCFTLNLMHTYHEYLLRSEGFVFKITYLCICYR